MFALQYGLAPVHRPNASEQSLRDGGKVTIMGLTFSNPVGIAAGFDKDGAVIQQAFDLGCGMLEIGSITLEPQPGNPKPRIFRLVEDGGVINRCGFNGLGSQVAKQNLETYMQRKMATNRGSTSGSGNERVLGINLGKNKIPSRSTPLEEYQELIGLLGPFADYLVINVSSPNTPGLRDLQASDKLRALLQGCIESRDVLVQQLNAEAGDGATPTTIDANADEQTSNANKNDGSRRHIPLLVKLAPDLSLQEMELIAEVLMEMKVDGMVLTNTSNQRPTSNNTSSSSGGNLLRSRNRHEVGGLSGTPIKDMSTDRIRTMYRLTNGSIPIIGVGGIANGYDAYEKVCAGASLVQLYTGMVYGGAGAISRIRKELAEVLIQHGHRSVEDAVGSDHADMYWKRQQSKMVAHAEQ